MASNRIKPFLEQYEISQTETASALGLSLATFNRKVNGTRAWKVEEVRSLLDFLRRWDPDVSFEDLFGEAA